MSERYNVNTQLEHLQSKYIGTGHADTTKFEWLSNQHRDTAASLIGHPNMLAHVAIVENISIQRAKFNFLQKMFSPCGPPPAKVDE